MYDLGAGGLFQVTVGMMVETSYRLGNWTLVIMRMGLGGWDVDIMS